MGKSTEPLKTRQYVTAETLTQNLSTANLVNLVDEGLVLLLF